MIQSNEIRIGNYFLDRGGKVLLIDHWECKDKVSTKQQFVESGDKSFPLHPMTEQVEYLQPIKLTEDWLDRFGLVKRNGYPHELMDGYIKIRNGVYFFKYYKLEVKLPFVHTLQNFYFSAKGKELELKPEI